ncbi:ROK family protein [Solimonas terrae]|uniref:ROK family protein n=1 Tax=Solimonas terrae TaxID=1396819 RepID=A0A6M2BT61_9GAMM|nr:ROK family protein [Solimonas terrae]NGY05842.1 ROK family protein [Solimonas terrae]
MRIGIDLGGTKIEGVVMADGSRIVARQRIATPAGDYEATLDAVCGLVRRLEAAAAALDLPIGVGSPGALSKASGLIKNSSSTCLNGRPLLADLEHRLGARVRLANDADCLALSEARDGAAAGADTVFAAILGTGVGGGIVVRGELLNGANGIAGEWGHNPLPWPQAGEAPGPACYCGRHGCIETWISGTGFAADHRRSTGEALRGEQIVFAADDGKPAAQASLQRYEQRLARALAHIVNVLDPQVVVLGGGISTLRRLYRTVPELWKPWIFSDEIRTRLVQAQFGDASGVRGAAWLWPEAG